MTINGSKL